MAEHRKFLMINPKELASKYPKSWKKLKAWLISGSPEGNVLTDDMMDMFVYGNSRLLYDFFDDNKIYIEVYTEEEATMNYLIRWDKQSSSPALPVGDRQKTETQAFNKALEIMEGKL